MQPMAKMLKLCFFLISCSMLLLLPLVLTLNSFLVFHAHLTRNPIFGAHNHTSPRIVQRHHEALREVHDPEVSAVNKSIGSKPLRNVPSLEYTSLKLTDVPSLEYTPLKPTREDRVKWFRDSFPTFKFLHSDSVSSEFSAKVNAFFKPCKLRFFITWISELESFGYREQLTMESVFKWNPSCCLLVISGTMDSKAGEEILRPFRNLGFRVKAVAPDLRYLFHKTPAEEWLRKISSGNIDPGEVPFAQNLSNILRLAVLYKYGGVYIDADMILLRSLSSLKNAIGAQSADPKTGQWNRLNNAVLAFDKRHPLLLKFIKEFSLTFDGNRWGHNGPYLLTRVVSSLPKRTRHDFKIMPPSAFYPVDWGHISSYFMSPSDKGHVKWINAKIIQLEKEAYAIHLWNKQSRGVKMEEGSIMYHIFNKNCIFCLSALSDT